jgi:hypothetical protein
MTFAGLQPKVGDFATTLGKQLCHVLAGFSGNDGRSESRHEILKGRAPLAHPGELAVFALVPARQRGVQVGRELFGLVLDPGVHHGLLAVGGVLQLDQVGEDSTQLPW